MYIRQFPKKVQDIIRHRLENEGLDWEDVEMAMDSKIADIEETIYVEDIKAEFGL